jgi:hypothetical protein
MLYFEVSFENYFHTAGEILGHKRHRTGTFEQGDEADDSAATVYEKFNFMEQPIERPWSILGCRVPLSPS